MKTNRALEDFLHKVGSEGLDYALFHYCPEEDIEKIGKVQPKLAGTLRAAKAWMGKLRELLKGFM